MAIIYQDSEKNKILKLNKKQKEFYNTNPPERKFNILMKLWRRASKNMYFIIKEAGIWEDVYRLQLNWMGNLTGKKVLDFGCYQGNALSDHLAEKAGEYYGIDLSERAIGRLAKHFEEKNITGAHLQAVDILSDEFKETDFDIVYAQGVLHHFNPINVLLPVLFAKLKSGGKIVSFDPMQTSILTRGVRYIYHPFRSDKEWEWPFSIETFNEIEKKFRIGNAQGIMGKSKWAIPVGVISKAWALELAIKLHKRDMMDANKETSNFWRCMHVVMCLEK